MIDNIKSHKMIKLKDTVYVGQRIELFKILTDGSYEDESLFVPGTIRPGYRPGKKELDPSGKTDYVRVLSNSIHNTFRGMWTKHTIFIPEVKPISAFIVKSVKNI